MKIEKYFKDIPEQALFPSYFLPGDIVWCVRNVNRLMSYSDLIAAKVIDVKSKNSLNENGVQVECALFDYNKTKIDAIAVFKYKDGGAITKDGIKYPITFLDDDNVVKTRFFKEKDLINRYSVMCEFAVPNSRLNLRVIVSGSFVFDSIDQIGRSFKKEQIKNPIFSTKGISVLLGESLFLFNDYYIYDNDSPVDLSRDALFNYMLYNCEPTEKTKNSFPFAKEFQLIVSKTRPVNYLIFLKKHSYTQKKT